MPVTEAPRSARQTAPRGGERGAETLFVASLEKGFRVLEAFRNVAGDLGLTEIAERTGLDKSAAQRFTNTLQKLGYLEKDPSSRRYRPAVRLLDFSYTYLHQDRLAETAMARLIEASKVYGTTVNLCELIDTDVIYTVRIPHEKASFPATVPGRRMPAYCTSGGTAIMAFRPAAEAAAIVDASDRVPMTDDTIVERRAVMARITEARELGFGIGVGQAMPNEISIAAPVLNARGEAIAAVQIPVYMPNWTPAEARQKIAPLAMETARSISGILPPEAARSA
ncbi:MAG: IclR family transcriptional regulator [Magnetovibrio sp.]|nr:IclR family transcriptional regulator [Magnetovibrio sp.]